MKATYKAYPALDGRRDYDEPEDTGSEAQEAIKRAIETYDLADWHLAHGRIIVDTDDGSWEIVRRTTTQAPASTPGRS